METKSFPFMILYLNGNFYRIDMEQLCFVKYLNYNEKR